MHSAGILVRTPTPRSDNRCWCCGKYGAPVDISQLTAIERSRLKQRVGIPLACPGHRETIQVELSEHAQRFRRRLNGTPS